MNRGTLRIFALLAIVSPAMAQFTQVSGTITDPTGLPYANGTIIAKLILPGGASATLGGLAYTPPSQPSGLNIAGFFLMQLADNTQLLPGGSQWSFTICSAAGTVQPAGGKGPVCFSSAAITISGSSQSLTTTLSALAVPLTQANAPIPTIFAGAVRWGYVTGASGTSPSNFGIANSVTEQGTFSRLNTTTDGVCFRITSGAVAGNQAGFTDNFNPPQWLLGRNLYYSAWMKNSNADLTNQRFYSGVTSLGGGLAAVDSSSNTDNPVGANAGQNYAFFRFSSVVPDTKWQCVTSNGTTQTVTNSGITADTNYHKWEIQFNDNIPNIVFSLDGTAACTVTATLPSAVTLTSYTMLTTQTAAAKVLDTCWSYMQETK